MSAPLSIIIPTLNAAADIAPTLAALVPAMTQGLARELIIVDGGSSDDIEQIAKGVGAVFITASPGRGGQLQAGAKAARGEWLLFLHADTVLSEDWAAAARAHMADNTGKAGYFQLRFNARGFAPAWVAGWANWRALLFGLPYGDQGLLISRALYEDVGGFRPMPLMEDVAMARALGRSRLALLQAQARTSAARYEKQGWFKRGWRNWTCLTLYLGGRRPEEIAERYRK